MVKNNTTIKKTISDAQLKNELIKLFESGNTSKTNLYELLRTKYKIEKQRCLKTYDIAIIEWQNTKEKSTNEAIQANAITSLESGLKSKLDRLLSLQKQEDDLNKELEVAIMVVHTFTDGEIIIGTRPMNSLEKAAINKTIKEIRAEISKIEGDYAPAKADVTTNGKQIQGNLDNNKIDALISLVKKTNEITASSS